MIGDVIHLSRSLQIQRVVEMERSPHGGVSLVSAETSNKIACCVSLFIALRKGKGRICSVRTPIEDAASRKSGTVQVEWPLRTEVNTARVGAASNRVEKEVTREVDRETCSRQHSGVNSPAAEYISFDIAS